MELGIEDEEDNLYKQANNVAENILDTLNKPNTTRKQDVLFEDKKEEKSNIHNSRNARYSCNINVYCNKLDENELNNIFNYINRRFGAEY